MQLIIDIIFIILELIFGISYIIKGNYLSAVLAFAVAICFIISCRLFYRETPKKKEDNKNDIETDNK